MPIFQNIDVPYFCKAVHAVFVYNTLDTRTIPDCQLAVMADYLCPPFHSPYDVALLCLSSRSPILGILSGAVAGLISLGTIFRIALIPHAVEETLEGSMVDAVAQPLVLTCFTCAYGMRGLRLIILYDSDIRERWGKLANERAMTKSLVILFVLIEFIVWSTALVFGVDR